MVFPLERLLPLHRAGSKLTKNCILVCWQWKSSETKY